MIDSQTALVCRPIKGGQQQPAEYQIVLPGDLRIHLSVDSHLGSTGEIKKTKASGIKQISSDIVR